MREAWVPALLVRRAAVCQMANQLAAAEAIDVDLPEPI